VLTIDLDEHPAVRAWSQLRTNQPPHSIEILRQKTKSAVYRLVGAGEGGTAIIAKRCELESARTEYLVYSEILPQAGASALQCFGFVEAPDGESAWLFIEDGGGKELRPRVDDHRDLISTWLSLLHGRASRVSAVSRAPDRGATHYLKHLQLGRQTILDNLDSPFLTSQNLFSLRSILRHCDRLATRWDRIQSFCDEMPRTLVHGDLAIKNMRVRSCGDRTELTIFDWETAGLAAPAADLAQLGSMIMAPVDLSLYHAIVSEFWPGLGKSDIEQCAAIGTLFRLIAMIYWESIELQTHSVPKSMWTMTLYEREMAHALSQAGLQELEIT